MYLKSLKLKNFRKFGHEGNEVEFVASEIGTDESAGSISSSTTLIVGKNNSGKTTITHALKKILNGNIKSGDFNYKYLSNVLDSFTEDTSITFPSIEFHVKISVNTDNTDLMANVAEFVSISNVEHDAKELIIDICIRYEPVETNIFNSCTAQMIKENAGSSKPVIFNKFLALIDDSEFALKYFNTSGDPVSDSKFRISDLISVKIISADKDLKDSILARTFNKLIKTRYAHPSNSKSLDSLEEKISVINGEITENIQNSHSNSINDVLHQIESGNHLGVQLSSDLTYDQLMQNLIKYEYTELGRSIPEGQFGLGYANLMSIIGEIIDYVETYPDDQKHSKIHLICIEEPENYMHPQMQELFITRIDRAIKLLLKNSGKKINSQLIITTHSSHVLNSKIHASNSLNNINYIATIDGFSHVIMLNDNAVMNNDPIPPDQEREVKEARLNDLKFLKTHIKFKVSDLFFSDAVIIVEGITEETIIPHYLSNDRDLQNFYISVFNINGAHGKVYRPLMKLLRIPVLLITDIDIKRGEEELTLYTQVTSLAQKTTTNETIRALNGGSNDLSAIEYLEDKNLFCIFQKDPIEGQQPTSLEEALILENHGNPVLNKTLELVRPQIYSDIVGKDDDKDVKKLITSSFRLQKKLSGSKSDFASTFLYQMIVEKSVDNIPQTPKYITDGFDWLKSKLISDFMKLNGDESANPS